MSEAFSFEGFEPNFDLTSYAKDMLQKLKYASPSDSSTQAYLVKTPVGYEGLLRVHFVNGSFQAQAKLNDPKGVINDLVAKVGEQLKEWKLDRFTIEPN